MTAMGQPLDGLEASRAGHRARRMLVGTAYSTSSVVRYTISHVILIGSGKGFVYGNKNLVHGTVSGCCSALFHTDIITLSSDRRGCLKDKGLHSFCKPFFLIR
jgi:hypothetical protein